MATGKEIKRLRGKKSALDVAALIGVSVDRLRKWEERDTDPADTGDIQKVENYFGVPLDGLVSLSDFDFVQYPQGVDFRDKYIKSLEDQVRTLKAQVSLLTGEMRHIELTNQAIVQANQDVLIEILAKQRRASLDAVFLEVSKAVNVNYQRAKKMDIVPDVGR